MRPLSDGAGDGRRLCNAFLDDRPVRARRGDLAEQFGRWCRRNKALATLAATALASLVFAAVVGWVGYATTRTALERESMRQREADAATRRAEANVALSLEALEEIFNNLTPRSFPPRRPRPCRPTNHPPWGCRSAVGPGMDRRPCSKASWSSTTASPR